MAKNRPSFKVTDPKHQYYFAFHNLKFAKVRGECEGNLTIVLTPNLSGKINFKVGQVLKYLHRRKK